MVIGRNHIFASLTVDLGFSLRMRRILGPRRLKSAPLFSWGRSGYSVRRDNISALHDIQPGFIPITPFFYRHGVFGQRLQLAKGRAVPISGVAIIGRHEAGADQQQDDMGFIQRIQNEGRAIQSPGCFQRAT
jgi:hypothetical protein